MFKKFVLSVAATLLASGVQAAPMLIVNGSFELGPGNIGSFSGWTTAIGDASTFVDSSGKTGTLYGQASDGLWAAYFGSLAVDGGASISQTFATVAGQRYLLGFDIANDNAGSPAINQFAASINGLSLYTLTNASDSAFVHVVESFLAKGASTTLQFTGSNDNSYVELDRVSVAAVPEPDIGVLALTGALVMAVGRRRVRARKSTSIGA